MGGVIPNQLMSWIFPLSMPVAAEGVLPRLSDMVQHDHHRQVGTSDCGGVVVNAFKVGPKILLPMSFSSIASADFP